MTTNRRIDAGPLLVLAGSVLLLISLFLAWYEPSLEAWDIFEVVDLLLAAIALGTIFVALGLVSDMPAAPDARSLPWLSGLAFVLVVAALLDRPPAVIAESDPDVGLWLALAASALMAAGTLLAVARVSISFDVASRERRHRVDALDARGGQAPATPAPATPAPDSSTAGGSGPLFGDTSQAEPTQPMPPTEERPKKR